MGNCLCCAFGWKTMVPSTEVVRPSVGGAVLGAVVDVDGVVEVATTSRYRALEHAHILHHGVVTRLEEDASDVVVVVAVGDIREGQNACEDSTSRATWNANANTFIMQEATNRVVMSLYV